MQQLEPGELAVMLLSLGLLIGTAPGQPAHAIFLLLTPQDNPAVQLDLSSNIAEMFHDRHALERALRAATFTEFLAVLKTLEPRRALDTPTPAMPGK